MRSTTPKTLSGEHLPIIRTSVSGDSQRVVGWFADGHFRAMPATYQAFHRPGSFGEARQIRIEAQRRRRSDGQTSCRSRSGVEAQRAEPDNLSTDRPRPTHWTHTFSHAATNARTRHRFDLRHRLRYVIRHLKAICSLIGRLHVGHVSLSIVAIGLRSTK